ncbi:MAG: UbiX family flavin prenyltransferase [Planctomycetes bacterium]|nr:UbiX family flavin prenyltransferase [Planctomycetota bacterium]
MSERRRIAVGITGASGAPIAVRLIELLLARDCEVHLTCSGAGRLVVREELDLGDGPRDRTIIPGLTHERLLEYAEKDYYAPMASGSSRMDAMVIVPCSMGTIGAIAAGTSDNLLRRAADVMLKERKPLIVVPREAPLSTIHLENLLRLTRAGATVIPPVLTFYQSPGDSVAAQVDFVVSRILDHLGIDNDLYPRWGMR